MKTLESVISDQWSVVSSQATGMAATRHATRATPRATRPPRAFTLIELLIVISIIALLAALTFPAVRAARISVMRARARAELAEINGAVERYQQKLGYYPPDNPNPADYWARNQLYYELLGTTNIGTAASPVYMTLDGSAQIKASDFGTVFGPSVTGIMNCARAGRGDEAPNAMPFLSGLKPGQFTVLTNATAPICTILVSAIEGPPLPGGIGGKINPWRYNSSSPQHNPKSFDLWVDILAGGKTNRICNWSDKPIIVYYTSSLNSYP
jgi:prepilin-type N-terminal cleavage/methylation domain-containing protein